MEPPVLIDEVIVCDPEIMSGVPVFAGSRVPVRSLFEYVAAGVPVSDFLDDFPTVRPDLAVKVLKLAEQALLARYPAVEFDLDVATAAG